MKDLENTQRIITEKSEKIGKEAWFYPEYKGVKGFLGEQDIFLMGLNPSSGIFPSHKDKLLYSLLKEKELENIHITDLIKTRALNLGVAELITNPKFMKQQINFLKNEINILKPKIIICMGSQCENLLKYYYPEVENLIKVFGIKHYSYRYQPIKEVFEEISEDLDKIKERYNILCKK